MARLKIHLLMLMLMLVVPCIISNSARAETSAIAFGSDNTWGWATRNNQQEANSAALKFCNKNNSKKDCALQATKAVVRAEGGGTVGYGVSLRSLADAKKRALRECGNASCKVTFEMTKPGFYSLAKSEIDKSGNGNFHLAYQFDDSDEADKQAKQRCENAEGRKCSIFASGAIPGTYRLSSAPSPSSISSENNCRPNTPTVRCSSRCTNGDCIVSYENGCQLRVQVQPRFDSYNNQWTYPSPSC